MTNISATKLVKSFKDNTLSLIQFCGDLDCLRPVKYLDNPEPDDIQKAFLFNGINYANYNWTYDAEGAQAELAQALKEQENHIKSELEKVEAALTSAKSERYLRSLLTEWLDAHNHYQAVHQRLHVLMSSRSSYLVNSKTNPVHPVLDTSSLR